MKKFYVVSVLGFLSVLWERVTIHFLMHLTQWNLI